MLYGKLRQIPAFDPDAEENHQYGFGFVFTAMNARLIADAEVTIEVPGRYASAETIAGVPEFAGALRAALEKVAAACAS